MNDKKIIINVGRQLGSGGRVIAKMLADDFGLRPNFWRAPTDNDYGANIQQKLGAWKHPHMQLKEFAATPEGKDYNVKAVYDLRSVDATLTMNYVFTAEGRLIVTQKLQVNPDAKHKPQLPRSGMQLVMPKDYGCLSYYGRGPIENYVDRKDSQFLRTYKQKVADQYWGYVRPQESGNKTDVRTWNVTDVAGKGLRFYGTAPLECSTLKYRTIYKPKQFIMFYCIVIYDNGIFIINLTALRLGVLIGVYILIL